MNRDIVVSVIIPMYNAELYIERCLTSLQRQTHMKLQILVIDVRVTLKPGHRMNYHSHERRDEIWTVIGGTGRAIIDGMSQSISAGDVISIEAGCRHTVIADTELALIEVQLGADIAVTDKTVYPWPENGDA